MTSEIVAIMFIDIAGYTKATTRMSRSELHGLHEDFDNIAVPIFHKYSGNVIKKIGDAFLVTFKSPTDAIWCGVDLQNAFAEHNHSHQHNPMHIRVALHMGDVIHRGNDIYGDAVNTAARVEGVAKAGHIVFTEAVFLAMNKNEIPYAYLGIAQLKGLKFPIKLFRVKGAYEDMIRRRMLAKKRFKEFFSGLLILLLVLGLLALLYFFIMGNYNEIIRGLGL